MSAEFRVDDLESKPDLDYEEYLNQLEDALQPGIELHTKPRAHVSIKYQQFVKPSLASYAQSSHLQLLTTAIFV